MFGDSLQERLQEMELENPSVDQEIVPATERPIDRIFRYLRMIPFVVQEVPQKKGIYSAETIELFERTHKARSGIFRTRGGRVKNLYRARDIAQQLQYDFSSGEFGEVTDRLLKEFLSESEGAARNNRFGFAISDADRAYEMTGRLGLNMSKEQIYSRVIPEMVRYIGESAKGGYFLLATSTADRAHGLSKRVGLDTTTEQIYGNIAREMIRFAGDSATGGYFTVALGYANQAYDLSKRVGLNIKEQEIYGGIVGQMIKMARKYADEGYHTLKGIMIDQAQGVNRAHKGVFDPVLSSLRI